jgi:LuxR family maltose regulon positive regulatory protein
MPADGGWLQQRRPLPPLPISFVPRARVYALLTAASARRLTLVTAGPGYGKSLAATLWAHRRPAGTVAWLHIEPGDDDAAGLWSAVLSALASTGTLPPDATLLDLRIDPDVSTGQEHELVRRLAALDPAITLVVDDVHELTDPGARAALTRLVRDAPPRMRFMLLGRTAPSLGQHRLRLTEQLAEVGSADLAFTATETAALMALADLPLNREEIDTLLHKTEGWATGLRLAAVVLSAGQSGGDVSRTLAQLPDEVSRRGVLSEQFNGAARPVAEYLFAEVLDRQDDDVRQMLLRTSVLETVNGDLADRLTGRPGNGAQLQALAATHALVSDMRGDGQWFRYHALLRDLLRHTLHQQEPDLEPRLHRQAALWFAGQARHIDAVRHALSGGDETMALRLLVDVALPDLLTSKRSALVAALRPSAERAAAQPRLAHVLAAAACHFAAATYGALAVDAESAARLVPELDEPDRTRTSVVIGLFRMAAARVAGDVQATAAHARDVLRLLSQAETRDMPAARRYRLIATGSLGAAELWMGQWRNAEAHLDDVVTEGVELHLGLPWLSAVSHRAVVQAVLGELTRAADEAAGALRVAQRRGWTSEPQIIPAHLAAFLVAFQRGEDDAAQSALNAGLAPEFDRGDQSAKSSLRIGAARLALARGDVGTATFSCALVRDDYGERPMPPWVRRGLALAEAETLLVAGDGRSALSRLENLGESSEVVPVLVRAHLATGDRENAARLVDGLLERPAPTRAAHVQTRVLAALVADSYQDDTAAIASLRDALAMARPENLQRPFRLTGSNLPGLLSRLQDAVPGLASFLARPPVPHDGQSLRQPADDALPPPLTPREEAVLRYLPSMLTHEQIGVALHVSLNTVKVHLRSLYRKLGVSTRSEAVYRARDLGLL